MRHKSFQPIFSTKLAFLNGAFAAAAVVFAASAQAAPIITVYPSLASNRNGSLTYSDYAANGDTSIENGGATTGTGAAQYSVIPSGTTLDYRVAVSTGFQSWQGVASPNTPAYPNEYGNKVVWGVDIKAGTGEKVSLSSLSEVAQSTDSANTLGYTDSAGSFTYGLGANNYGNDFVGITFGTGPGGTNTIISSGDPSQPVDEIIGSGDGSALAALSHEDYVSDPIDNGIDPFPADATDQDRINGTAHANGIDSDFGYSGTYMIDGSTGSANVTFSVPEPTALASIFLGGGLLVRRPRKKA